MLRVKVKHYMEEIVYEQYTGDNYLYVLFFIYKLTEIVASLNQKKKKNYIEK
jgi:hypothetical protein